MNTFRNMAGYLDPTAGEAINKADKEMVKRNCRRTMDKKYIHEKAIKMRKMTDEQLVFYVENRVEKARSEGINQGKRQRAKKPIASNQERKIYMCQCGNTRINTMDNFCCICGQEILWECDN